MARNNQRKSAMRSGGSTLIALGVAVEIVLLIFCIAIVSQRGAPNSMLLALLITAMLMLPLGVVYAWLYYERNGWYFHYDVQIPDLPYTPRGLFGAKPVTFAPNGVFLTGKPNFVEPTEILYSELKKVYFRAYPNLSLSKTTHRYYKVGEEPMIVNLSPFSQKECVIILRILAVYVPHAEFDETAQDLKSGYVSRV